MRSREEENPVSLFPFLSVLASVMGCLILTICGAVVGSFSAEDTSAAAAVAETRRSMDLLGKEKERLEKQLADAQAVAGRRAKMEDEEKRLKAGIAAAQGGAQKQAQRAKELEGELGRLKERITDREGKRRRLAAALGEMDARIEKARGDAVVKPDDRVVIVPSGGTGRNLIPRFVEADSQGIILHPEGTRIAANDIQWSPVLRACLDEVKRNQGWSLVILCRPDGVIAHNRLLEVALKANAPHGSLPVLAHEKPDLSAWHPNK